MIGWHNLITKGKRKLNTLNWVTRIHQGINSVGFQSCLFNEKRPHMVFMVKKNELKEY
jgi:hypothetical protein